MNSKRKEDNLVIILLSDVVADQGPCDQHIGPDARAAELLQETGGDYRYWTLRTVSECWSFWLHLAKSSQNLTEQTDQNETLSLTEQKTAGESRDRVQQKNQQKTNRRETLNRCQEI